MGRGQMRQILEGASETCGSKDPDRQSRLHTTYGRDQRRAVNIPGLDSLPPCGYQDLPAESHLSMVWSPLLEIPPEHVVRNREEVTDKVSVVYPVPTGPTPMHVQSEVMQSRAGAAPMEVEPSTSTVKRDIAAASSSRQEVSCDAAGRLPRGTRAAAEVPYDGTGPWEGARLWECESEEGPWLLYPSREQLLLDEAASKNATIKWRRTGTCTYEIDPTEGYQRHVDTGRIRRVRRRGDAPALSLIHI